MPSPFTPGWNPDRQHRVAREAQHQGQVNGLLPALLNAGLKPTLNSDQPNPSFVILTRARYVALIAQDFTQLYATPLPLLGKDAMVRGVQSTDNLPPRAAPRARDYSITQTLVPVLIGQDAMAVGQQSTDLPPRAAARARDYSISQSGYPFLSGKDARNAGQQQTELPTTSLRRAATLSEPGTNAAILLPPPAVATLPAGAQSTDLPPRAAARARDYTLASGYTLELIGQDAMLVGVQSTDSLPPRAASRARDYSIAESGYPFLQGADATLVGKQVFDLPPVGPARARDYTWTQSLTLGLRAYPKTFFFHTEATLGGAPTAPAGCATLSEIGPDATDAAAGSLLGGHTASGNTAPRSVLNKPAAKDSLVDLAGSPPTTVPGGSRVFGWFSDQAYSGTFAAGNWTAQLRDDDNQSGVAGHWVINVFTSTSRSFSGSFRSLGQIVSGTDWWDGATTVTSGAASLAAQTLTNEYLFYEVWCNETTTGGGTLTLHQEGSELTAANRSSAATPLFSPFPVPTGQQSTDLPPRAAARAQQPDPPQVPSAILLPPVVPLPAGAQVFDLAPRASARAREYNLTQAFPLSLLGKDAMVPGQQVFEVPQPRRVPRQPEPHLPGALRLPIPVKAPGQTDWTQMGVPLATLQRALRPRPWFANRGMPSSPAFAPSLLVGTGQTAASALSSHSSVASSSLSLHAATAASALTATTGSAPSILTGTTTPAPSRLSGASPNPPPSDV